MAQLKTGEEAKLMRISGKITAKALKKALLAAAEGVDLLELERLAREEILKNGGKVSFETEPGYKWATCLTVNEEVVHGIPRHYILQKGDILGVDVGAIYKGWHTDAAWSKIIGEEKLPFLEIGEIALWKGIDQAVAGNRIGDISEAIQREVEDKGGYSVVRALVGHGVGKKLHEDPEVPGYGKKGTGPLLKEGMTIAVEVIYTAGKPEVVHERDGWTIVSADGSMGGLFEMSLIVRKDRAEVLTDWRQI